MGRDGFDPARAQVFQPLERFGSPSAADIRIGEWVKAFYQAVCQKCAASLGRESAASAISSMEMPLAPAYSRAPVSTMWRLWRFTLAGRRKTLRKTNPAAAGFGRGLQEPGAPGMRSWRSARDRGRACGQILAGHPQAGILHRSAAARRAVS